MDQHRSNPTPPGTTLPPLQARKYLGRFGLHGDLALQPVKFLSGGQKSRLAFAELAWWGGPREAQGPRPKEVKGPTRQEAKIHPNSRHSHSPFGNVYQFNDVPWHSGQKIPDLADNKELTSHHASG